jgi:hypothetical protein
MSSTEATLLNAAEEAALAELLAGPLVGVSVRIAVKFRAMQHDLGTVTIINHSWQWPVPALFAAANPRPVSLNTHGIQMDITLSQPTAAAPAASVSADTNNEAGPAGGDLLSAS